MVFYFKINTSTKKVSNISEKRFYDLIEFSECYYDHVVNDAHEFDNLFAVVYFFAYKTDYSDYIPIGFYVDIDDFLLGEYYEN